MAKTAVFYWKNPLFDIDGDLYVVDQNSNASENRHPTRVITGMFMAGFLSLPGLR